MHFLMPERNARSTPSTKGIKKCSMLTLVVGYTDHAIQYTRPGKEMKSEYVMQKSQHMSEYVMQKILLELKTDFHIFESRHSVNVEYGGASAMPLEQIVDVTKMYVLGDWSLVRGTAISISTSTASSYMYRLIFNICL